MSVDERTESEAVLPAARRREEQEYRLMPRAGAQSVLLRHWPEMWAARPLTSFCVTEAGKTPRVYLIPTPRSDLAAPSLNTYLLPGV